MKRILIPLVVLLLAADAPKDPQGQCQQSLRDPWMEILENQKID